MSERVQSLISLGNDRLVIDIECHLSNSLPNIVIVGFANKAVDESKERIRSAFSSSNIQLPKKRITVNLAPANVPKDSSSVDLAIASSILIASKQVKQVLDSSQAMLGELGLNGDVRAVRGIIGKLLAGRKRGITMFYIPAANLSQALLVPGITVVPFSSFRQFYLHLNEIETVAAIETHAGKAPEDTSPSYQNETEYALSDVVGKSKRNEHY